MAIVIPVRIIRLLPWATRLIDESKLYPIKVCL